MKVLIAICMFIGLASASVWVTRNDMPKFMEECAKELAIPEDLLEKYQMFEYSDDPKAMCFYQCVVYRLFLGNLIIDHTEEFHTALAACMNKMSSDPIPASEPTA
ncbi:general odorant-binding protein 99a-like [Drosophila ficusphila]|uniref:general odorant-binding protein 99a-like n=1 Tax=Drosophila ficusphila TaxID=30025 RepID=UPI0007E5F784|nr:general odorant-binding protein 99a-like [Drosophila ficusphila]